ncbi:pentapeptide repeat-containing protein [Cerasibacillus sp. JNUCC 74]
MINPIDRIKEVYFNNQKNKRLFLGKVDKNLLINDLFLPNLKSGTIIESKNITLYEDFKSIGKVDNKILAVFSKLINTKTSEIIFEGVFSLEDFLKEYGSNLNLDGLHFPGADLSGANLSASSLSNSNLIGANLTKSNLRSVDFSNSNLQGVDFEDSNMLGSTFISTDLRRTNLKHCELRESTFKGVPLRGAELWGAYLWGVNLDECFIDGVDVSRADTRGS